jgi:hypothetical protein
VCEIRRFSAITIHHGQVRGVSGAGSFIFCPGDVSLTIFSFCTKVVEVIDIVVILRNSGFLHLSKTSTEIKYHAIYLQGVFLQSVSGEPAWFSVLGCDVEAPVEQWVPLDALSNGYTDLSKLQILFSRLPLLVEEAS